MRKSTIVTTIMALATMATVNVNAATAITSSKGLNACLGMYGWERQEHYSVPGGITVELSGNENDELVGFYYDGMELFIQPWCLIMNGDVDTYLYESSSNDSSENSSEAWNRVDVNITDQWLKYYDYNGTVALSCHVATGMDGHETPTGWMNIIYKDKDTYLSGEGYRKHVDNWMVFYQWYDENGEVRSEAGFHDCDWKDVNSCSNKSGGSLGCVNMNSGDADTLYSLIDGSTTVYIHY